MVELNNDGKTPDAFRVSGCWGTSVARIAYRAGATRISSEVKAGTYTTESLGEWDASRLRVVARVRPTATAGDYDYCRVVATSVGNPTRQDAVRAGVRVTE